MMVLAILLHGARNPTTIPGARKLALMVLTILLQSYEAVVVLTPSKVPAARLS